MARLESESAHTGIEAYRQLFDNARNMLQAAQEERWDDLAALQGERQDCLFQVRKSDQQNGRFSDFNGRKSLIEAILACDAQTRLLVANYQQDLLGTFGTSRKLADAYRSTER